MLIQMPDGNLVTPLQHFKSLNILMRDGTTRTGQEIIDQGIEWGSVLKGPDGQWYEGPDYKIIPYSPPRRPEWSSS